MKTVTERFLKYVSFDTMSDELSETCPSTGKEKLLGAALVEEMKEMGISDAFMDEDGYVYGTVPGNPALPTIGLIAHMDTSPDASGADIKAKIVEYTGEDICLNEEKGIFLRRADYPNLKNHMGKHLIVTDGTTLLGADDKAGIAEILTAALTWGNVWKFAILAVLVALLGITMCTVFHKAEHFAHHHVKNPWIRIAVGGVLVMGMTLLVGDHRYNGAGMDMALNTAENWNWF